MIGERDLLREPFPPRRSKPWLADLARHQLDVGDLQDHCARTYTEWHSRRLDAVAKWLSKLQPFPDIVVFPECAVALEDLHLLRTYAVSHSAVIFAGTHTVRVSHESAKHYDALNAIVAGSRQAVKRFQGSHVLPVLTAEQTLLHVKTAPSVFEHTDTSNAPGTVHHVEPLRINIRGRALRILPLVCSEALTVVSPTAEYDIAVIVARHDHPSGFDPYITTNVTTKHPVVLCNEGAFGGSGIHTIVDARMSGIWWWNPPVNGRLPPGDAILIADIDLDAVSVQQGVANPARPAALVAVASIVADGDKSGAYGLAQELSSIAQKEDNSVQKQLLDAAQQQFQPKGLTQVVLPQATRLAHAGVLNPELARSLLDSCILTGAPTLGILEHDLAARCIDHVTQISDNADTDDTEALATMLRFRRECKLRLDAHALSDSAPANPPPPEVALDREPEARSIRQFLEHPRQRVLCLTGLDDVGKSTLLSMVFAQAGHKATQWITLSTDSTLTYIASVFARLLRFPDDAAQQPREFLNRNNTDLVDRIPLGTVVVICEADNLRDHGRWREPDAPRVLEEVAHVLADRKGKLILSSTARLDLPMADQNLLRRMYLEGLPAEFAKLLLDQQLRRVGLDPRNFTDQQRGDIVELLGYHPGAIILCADFIMQQSVDAVHADLKQRRGVHTDIVRRILKGMEFTDSQSTILALLGETRSPIPPQVLSKAMRTNVSSEINALVAQGIVERGWRDFIKLPDLVRGFADLATNDSLTRTLFHKTAAEELADLSRETKDRPQLDFAIASQFHANLAGDKNLGASLGYVVDGTLGSIRYLVERHEYEKAKPIVDALLKATRSAEVYQLGALINARLGMVDEALTLAKEAYSADNEREWIVTEVGRLALFVHRTDIATECVSLVKRTGHDSSNLATLEGKIALRDGGDEAAVEAFRRAVQLTEANERWQDAWPHFFLGRTLIKLGKADEAIDVLYNGEAISARKRRRNMRQLVAIRTQLAIAYILTKDIEGAKRIFDLLGTEEAGSAEVVWAYALFAAATGDITNGPDLARQTLKKLNPATAKDRYGRCQVHLFRALVFLAIGNKGQASEEFSKANEQDPRNVFVLLRWAQTLVELANQSIADGDEHAARMCAEHAKSLADNVLKFHPGNAEGLALLEKLSDEFNVL